MLTDSISQFTCAYASFASSVCVSFCLCPLSLFLSVQLSPEIFLNERIERFLYNSDLHQKRSFTEN